MLNVDFYLAALLTHQTSPTMHKFLTTALSLFAVLSFSCNGDNDDNATPAGGGGGVTPPVNGPLTITTPCSVQMTVNGTNVSYSTSNIAWQCGTGTSGGGMVVNPGDLARITFNGFIADDDGMTCPIDIVLGDYQYPGGGPIPEATFFGFFGTGPMTYGNPETQLGKVEVGIWDNGMRFSTSCGPGTQTSSNFQITQLQQFPSQFVSDAIKIRVTFNCTLYPCDGAVGEPRVITNGTAVVGISNWD